jgi:hypothetical protein
MPLAEHRIIDSNKRTLVKYVFTAIDGTQSANTVLVDTSTLAYALSNTGNVMVANTNPRPSREFLVPLEQQAASLLVGMVAATQRLFLLEQVILT